MNKRPRYPNINKIIGHYRAIITLGSPNNDFDNLISLHVFVSLRACM